MRSIRRLVRPLVCSFAAAVILVFLAFAPTASAGGDAAAGKAKSLACAACHVAATGDTPHLVGQREGYIAKQLKAFKAGDRKNPVMQAITGVLNEGDIDNLAAYWASQPAGSDATIPEEVAAIKKSKMAFPKDFPKGFVQYATSNKEDQKAVGKAYINTVGFQAVKAGKPLPDGTIIIISNSAAKLDAEGRPVVDKDGTSWVADKVKGFEGMEMRAGWGKDIPEPLRNGNWNYALFTPEKAQRTEVNQAVCLACHIPASSASFVFGMKKIEAKVAAK